VTGFGGPLVTATPMADAITAPAAGAEILDAAADATVILDTAPVELTMIAGALPLTDAVLGLVAGPALAVAATVTGVASAVPLAAVFVTAGKGAAAVLEIELAEKGGGGPAVEPRLTQGARLRVAVTVAGD
jgi:hypothetical protein